MNHTHLEIAIEVAWQIGDAYSNIPRAECRWFIADVVKAIIDSGIIDTTTEDIDEVIGAWIDSNLKEAA
jgi:hypothetical protein